MINVSDEFKSVISGQNRTLYGGATITLLDGTVLNLDNSNIIGLKVDDATSQSGTFTIGSAIINKLTLSINNLDDTYSNYDFTGAIIRPTAGLQLSSTIETLNKGVFTADDPRVKSSVITLTALDNMSKFDKAFSDVSIVFPTTAQLLLTAVCTHCGVSLATTTFDHDDYIINERPLDSAVNCREIVSWIAQLGGNYARCNTSGALELKWYDFEVFEQPNLDGGYFDKTQVTYTESKSGTSITSSEIAKNSTTEITKIEGTSYQAVTVQGKNLFNYADIEIGAIDTGTGINVSSTAINRLKHFIPCAANTNYSLSGLASGVRVFYYNNSGAFLSSVLVGNGVLTTPSSTANIRLHGTIGNLTAITQLELGSTATAYSPFIPNSPSPLYPSPIITPSNFNLTASNGTDSNSLTVTQSMGALPNGVKNTIEKVNGVTKYIQRVGSVVFDGSTDEAWSIASTSVADKSRFVLSMAGIKPNINNSTVSNILSDRLIANSPDNTYGAKNGIDIAITGAVVIYHDFLSAMTLVEFKAWLSSNTITVQYELATPIETIIPDLTLTSYKGTTSIVSTSNPQVTITAAFNETIGVQDKYYSGDNADGGNFTDYSSGDNYDGGDFTTQKRYHHIYSLANLSLSTDDVVITGISVTDSSETPNTVLFGQSGYVISLSGNKLIQSLTDATTIANTVGAKIVGMKFRPCSLTAISDPSREAGDVAYVTDRKQNTYQVLLSNVSFGIGQADKISCDAESANRNSAMRYDVATKTIVDARKYTEIKLNAYDLAVQQMTSLIVHAFGLYKTSEVMEDGSTIFYSHDKPTRAESSFVYQENSNGFFVSNDGGQTWNSGWDSEGNAVFNVLSAIGINAEWIKVISSFAVGDKFSVDANGKLTASDADISGKITALSGKIANMVIENNGFTMNNQTETNFFKWQIGNTIMSFFDEVLDILSNDSVKLHGNQYEISASDYGFTIIFNNPSAEGGVARISASDGENGTMINIEAIDGSSYKNENILVNGVPMFQQLQTALLDITALKQRVIELQTQIDYYH